MRIAWLTFALVMVWALIQYILNPVEVATGLPLHGAAAVTGQIAAGVLIVIILISAVALMAFKNRVASESKKPAQSAPYPAQADEDFWEEVEAQRQPIDIDNHLGN